MDLKEQYLLVPNPRDIVVRSMQNGRRVCVLVPENEGDVLRALSLVWLPTDSSADGGADVKIGSLGEWVILAGCENGSIQEWEVSSLYLSSNCGRKPRRTFQLECSSGEGKDTVKLTNLEVLHLASPESYDEQVSQVLSDTRGGSLLFALVKGNAEESDAVSSTWLTRCLIPSYRSETKEAVHASMITSQKFVDSNMSKEELFKLQTRHVCLKEGDSVFGFLAAYRPNMSLMNAGRSYDIMGGNESKCAGDIFVVMCSSFGLIVYHENANSDPDTLGDSDNVCLPLIHFTGTTKQHVAHISSDSHLFSSVAISPDVKDIVLGRSNGQINLLDDVFDSITNYIVTLKNKMLENKEDDVPRVMETLQHPHVSSVRRTVHWHSHPVVAVSFLAASGSRAFSSSMTKSLISGGEESVLATWQLDRNFHRPTHFLARVSKGAIIHVTCCHQSGKIVISCSDNLMRCCEFLLFV